MSEERSEKEVADITLEDVDVALRICIYFYNKAIKVKKMLERFGLGRATAVTPSSLDDFIRLAFQYASREGMVKPPTEVEEEEEGVTQEELAKFKRLVEKIKRGEVKIEQS